MITQACPLLIARKSPLLKTTRHNVRLSLTMIGCARRLIVSFRAGHELLAPFTPPQAGLGSFHPCLVVRSAFLQSSDRKLEARTGVSGKGGGMSQGQRSKPYTFLQSIRFLLVDDEVETAATLADTLAHFTGMECVGVFAEGCRALEVLRNQRVDVVLLDLHMPAMSGVDFLRRLKRQAGTAVPAVLVLTCDDSDRALEEALGWGADGFLVKGTGVEALAHGIESVLAGGAALSPQLTRRLIRRNFHPPPPGLSQHPGLTQRERQVLDYLSRGFSYHRIAKQEKISMETVKTHARRIFGKLGVHSRAEAVAACWREQSANEK